MSFIGEVKTKEKTGVNCFDCKHCKISVKWDSCGDGGEIHFCKLKEKEQHNRINIECLDYEQADEEVLEKRYDGDFEN